MNLLRTSALALVLTLSLANAMMDADESASASSQRVRNLDTVQQEITAIISKIGPAGRKRDTLQTFLTNLGSDFTFNREINEEQMRIFIGAKQVDSVWSLLGITLVEQAAPKAPSKAPTPHDSEDEDEPAAAPQKAAPEKEEAVDAALAQAQLRLEAQQRYIDELEEARTTLVKDKEQVIEKTRKLLKGQLDVAQEKETALQEELIQQQRRLAELETSQEALVATQLTKVEELRVAQNTLYEARAEFAKARADTEQKATNAWTLLKKSEKTEADLREEIATYQIQLVELETARQQLHQQVEQLGASEQAREKLQRDIDVIRTRAKAKFSEQAGKVSEMEKERGTLLKEKAEAAAKAKEALGKQNDEIVRLTQIMKDLDEEQQETALTKVADDREIAALRKQIADISAIVVGKKKVDLEALKALLNPEA